MQHIISSDCISFRLSPSSLLVEINKLKHAEFPITAFECNCKLCWLQAPSHRLIRIHLGTILYHCPHYIFCKVLLKYNVF